MVTRCAWVSKEPLYIHYHDHEWGVPEYDDQKLFELLILEGAQAGLSWEIILKRRHTYQLAYDLFDPQKVARYDDEKKAALLQDPGIIRNRLKVDASINNAREFLRIQETHGSFRDYLWQFVDGEPLQNSWASVEEVPTSTAQSDALSKDLKQRGFKFVGTTICYAYMQATGLVNDHTTNCFRYKECQ